MNLIAIVTLAQAIDHSQKALKATTLVALLPSHFNAELYITTVHTMALLGHAH